MLILLLTVGAILSYLASNAGSLAIHHLTLPLTDAAQQTLETHETMGRWTWLFFAMAAGVTAMTGLSLRLVRYPATILAVLLMMILTGWIIKVGHDGGSLVYQHGVGVPASTNNTAPAP